VKKAVLGNGNPRDGLIVRVDRIEMETQGDRRRFARLLAVLGIGIAATAVLVAVISLVR